ncbi:unnamed protein product [Clonostachys rhizophaga]|uniref:Tafazzin family protein n=1 Tax=Clonostachys rhizophaga TaxID=160324 RepID=A0A9N9V8D9_9HYPO|nr:unnamed protein product [Clonostachys rhizophaga]
MKQTIMSGTAPPQRPSLPWRLGSMAVMGSVGMLSRGFLYGLNSVEVDGLDNLLGVLDKRKTHQRNCGLLTVCNHAAVIDDPLIWGILPMRYAFDPENLRWGLGAHDICFKNKALSTFFSLGQVLPTHRSWHSSHGGLFQPTMTEALKLLSSPSSVINQKNPLTFSTDSKDSFVSPAQFVANHHAWVHVFPEACCHQNQEGTLRYFKWGVSRLILESEPAPDFIPMYVHGTQNIMSEERGFPRWAPRIGQRFRMIIGEPTNVGRLFERERSQWRSLVEKAGDPDLLKDQPEAVQLRIDVAKRVRDEIGKLRETMGFAPDDDKEAALAETWLKEPNKRKFRSPVDGSLVNRH